MPNKPRPFVARAIGHDDQLSSTEIMISLLAAYCPTCRPELEKWQRVNLRAPKSVLPVTQAFLCSPRRLCCLFALKYKVQRHHPQGLRPISDAPRAPPPPGDPHLKGIWTSTEVQFVNGYPCDKRVLEHWVAWMWPEFATTPRHVLYEIIVEKKFPYLRFVPSLFHLYPTGLTGPWRLRRRVFRPSDPDEWANSAPRSILNAMRRHEPQWYRRRAAGSYAYYAIHPDLRIRYNTRNPHNADGTIRQDAREPDAFSQLNGSHGEYTNEDDHMQRGRGGRGRGEGRRPEDDRARRADNAAQVRAAIAHREQELAGEVDAAHDEAHRVVEGLRAEVTDLREWVEQLRDRRARERQWPLDIHGFTTDERFVAATRPAELLQAVLGTRIAQAIAALFSRLLPRWGSSYDVASGLGLNFAGALRSLANIFPRAWFTDQASHWVPAALRSVISAIAAPLALAGVVAVQRSKLLAGNFHGAAEALEEVASRGVTGLRPLIIAMETASRHQQAIDPVVNAALALFHVLLHAMPLPLALLTHVWWNNWVRSRVQVVHVAEIAPGRRMYRAPPPPEGGDRPLDDLRPHDMRGAPTDEIVPADRVEVAVRFGRRAYLQAAGRDWLVADDTREAVIDLYPDVLAHLCSPKVMATVGTTVETLMARLETSLRSNQAVNWDRAELLEGGGILETVEVAARVHLARAHNAAAKVGRCPASVVVRPGLTGFDLNEQIAPLANNSAFTLNVAAHHRPFAPKKRRYMASQIYAAPAAVPPRPDVDSGYNALSAVFKRIGRATPWARGVVSIPRLRRLAKFTEELCRRTLKPLPPGQNLVGREAVENWLRGRDYPMTRKAELLQAYDRHITRPGNEKIPSQGRGFLKREDYPAAEQECNKEARWIVAAEDVALANWGPMAVPMLEAIEHYWPEVVKKVAPNDRLAYICERADLPGRRPFKFDATAAETGHCNRVMRATSFIVYRHLLSQNPDALKHFNEVIVPYLEHKPHIMTKWFLLSLTEAIMNSGVADTSLRHIATLVPIHKFLVWERAKRAHHEWEPYRTFFMAVEGDDGAGFLPPELMPTKSDYESVGFDATFERCPDVGDMGFCRWYCHEAVRHHIADPRVWLAHVSFLDEDAVKPARADLMVLMKCLSALCEAPDAPVIGPIAHALVARYAHLIPAIDKYLSTNRTMNYYERLLLRRAIKDKVWARTPNVHPLSRQAVHERWGVTEQAQIELEQRVPFMGRYDVYQPPYQPPPAWQRYFSEHYVTSHYDVDLTGAPITKLKAGVYRVPEHLTAQVGRAAGGLTAPELVSHQVYHRMSSKDSKNGRAKAAGQPRRANPQKQATKKKNGGGSEKPSPNGQRPGKREKKKKTGSSGTVVKLPSQFSWPLRLLPTGAVSKPGGGISLAFRRCPVPSAVGAMPKIMIVHSALLKKMNAPPAPSGGVRPLEEGRSPVGGNFALDHADVITDGSVPPPKTGLSDVAGAYMKALTNPFSNQVVNPCVPVLPTMMTMKTRTLLRGSFSTGTAAYGYILVAPTVASNNTNKVHTTTSAWTGNGGTLFGLGPAAGITAAPDAALPFTAAQITAGVYARLVAIGLRVRNISQALNVGGLLAGSQLPDGWTAANLTPEQLLARQDTVVVPQALQPGNDWSVIVWRPTDDALFAFQPGPDINGGVPTMIFCAAAPSASAVQTYEYELVEYWEWMGGSAAIAVQNLTLSEADVVGCERVLTAAQRLPLTLNQDDWNLQMAHGVVEDVVHSDTVARTIEAVAGHTAGLVRAAVPMVRTIASFLGL